jgi:pimeloyl-ACP methyl ester carboxylesterase
MSDHSPHLEYFNVAANEAMGLEAHQMAYWRWSSTEAKRLVVCVHGLTRQGRDFDVLAKAIVQAYAQRGESVCVICPDVVGRGHSQWLKNPMHYLPVTYAWGLKSLIDSLCGQHAFGSVDWVGTSMGGIIGMLVCGVQGLQTKEPISRLVLNDVGPVVSWTFIKYLKTYLGKGDAFESLDKGVEALRLIASGFGPHTSEEWFALSQPMFKQNDAGQWIFHYDPQIAAPFVQITEESSLAAEHAMWQVYDQIGAQVLLIKGELSELMSDQDALHMSDRGPRAKVFTVNGVGHAPTLMHEEQIKILLDFLIHCG